MVDAAWLQTVRVGDRVEVTLLIPVFATARPSILLFIIVTARVSTKFIIPAHLALIWFAFFNYFI